MLLRLAFNAELVDGIRGDCAEDDVGAYLTMNCVGEVSEQLREGEVECEHDHDTDHVTVDLGALLRARVEAGVEEFCVPHEKTVQALIDEIEGYLAYLRTTLLPAARAE